ncbi:MAG: hypothetical protein HFG87_01260 [Dorea sp.]|nr:hypothetical protein [Dorea sp.]
MCMKWVIVEYYNVKFYLMLKGIQDFVKFAYLQNRIEAGEQLLMKDIYSWCDNQKIYVITKFEYLREISVMENLWNFYSYLRAKVEYRKLKRLNI